MEEEEEEDTVAFDTFVANGEESDGNEEEDVDVLVSGDESEGADEEELEEAADKSSERRGIGK